MKTKESIVCRADSDFNTTAAKLLIMAGSLMVDASPHTTAASKEAARVFVEGVISAAVSGGYTKASQLRDALGSSQRPNRLAAMAHEACKAAGHTALAGLIAGGVS
jgi:ABC-type methionine transport system permease subunit